VVVTVLFSRNVVGSAIGRHADAHAYRSTTNHGSPRFVSGRTRLMPPFGAYAPTKAAIHFD